MVCLHPLIGVSTSEMRVAARVHPLRESEPARRELALGLSYPEAVKRSGAVAVVLPPGTPDETEAILDRLSGLCLSGGPDLDPSAYAGDEHPMLGPREPDLDRFELALCRGAWKRGMPILGICRGAQVLNVSRNGTLIQHLPDTAAGSVEHRQDRDGAVPTHDVAVAPDSRLATILGASDIAVNSFHHQAVDRLGRGLTIVARSPDGIVEAVERRDAFAIGVQWHAEGMHGSPEQERLFEAFTEAAAEYERASHVRQAAA